MFLSLPNVCIDIVTSEVFLEVGPLGHGEVLRVESS